jgi:enoyl-CoA hydratase
MLIDRDRNPQWRPATLAEVADSMLDAHFARIGDRELRFD